MGTISPMDQVSDTNSTSPTPVDIQSNTLSSQPQNISDPKLSNKLPLILFIVFGFAFFGAGGYWLGLRNVPPKYDEPMCCDVYPILESEPTIVPVIDLETESSTSSTESITTNKLIIIPSDWKTATVVDSGFGIKTTIQTPPNFTFEFSGSETTLRDSQSNEAWDYTTSIYPTVDSNEIAINHYHGESRRVWFANYLKEKNPWALGDDVPTILQIQEKPLNSTTYLDVLVKNGGHKERYILYVQNNIVNIFQPISSSPKLLESDVSQTLEPVLASLKIVQIPQN